MSNFKKQKQNKIQCLISMPEMSKESYGTLSNDKKKMLKSTAG